MIEWLIFGGLLGSWVVSFHLSVRRGRRMRALRADPHKIHALEYELGMREDAPPTVHDVWKDAYRSPVTKQLYDAPPTDAPGSIFAYNPPREPVGPTFDQPSYDRYKAEFQRRVANNQYAHQVPPPLPHELEDRHGHDRTTDPEAPAPRIGLGRVE